MASVPQKKIDNSGFGDCLKTLSKAKKIMLKKQLRRASCLCPSCNKGRVKLRLLGARDHLHADCNECGFKFME